MTERPSIADLIAARRAAAHVDDPTVLMDVVKGDLGALIDVAEAAAVIVADIEPCADHGCAGQDCAPRRVREALARLRGEGGK